MNDRRLKPLVAYYLQYRTLPFCLLWDDPTTPNYVWHIKCLLRHHEIRIESYRRKIEPTHPTGLKGRSRFMAATDEMNFFGSWKGIMMSIKRNKSSKIKDIKLRSLMCRINFLYRTNYLLKYGGGKNVPTFIYKRYIELQSQVTERFIFLMGNFTNTDGMCDDLTYDPLNTSFVLDGIYTDDKLRVIGQFSKSIGVNVKIEPYMWPPSIEKYEEMLDEK